MFARTLLVCAAAVAATVAAPSGAAAEDLRWGSFKDNGCINPLTHPGLRSKSAVLWGIPGGQSWEATCASTPATIDGVRFAHPAVCVNTALADPLASGVGGVVGGIACGATALALAVINQSDVSDILAACGDVIVAGADMVTETIENGYYDRPAQAIAGQARVKRWPFRLFGAVTPRERSGWKAKLAAAVGHNGVGQLKQNGGGLNIWGVFAVPDETCLPPDYIGLRNAPHDQAAQACRELGQRLCTQAELCASGKPVMGQPEGDYWAPVGDRPNAWISIGTSYPERLCRTHKDALGQQPQWGTVLGPMPVTGKPTTLRCCR